MARFENICAWEIDSEDALQSWSVEASEEEVRPWSLEKNSEEDAPEIEELLTAIELAAKFVGDDYNNDEEPRFSQSAYRRAVNFLLNHAEMLTKKFCLTLPTPQIGPGPNGSVDLHWKLKNWELLINVPADEEQLAGYYGDDYSQKKVRGTFSTGDINLGLITWLLES